MDVWDGYDDEPIVTHDGKNFTSKIYLRDALDTVAREAFSFSSFPLIIYLKNHCSLLQQRRMALHIKNIIGHYLITSVLDPKDAKKLMSPHQMKKKIIIASQSEVGNYYMETLQRLLPESLSDQSISPYGPRPCSMNSCSSGMMSPNEPVPKVWHELSQTIAIGFIPKPNSKFREKGAVPTQGVSSINESDVTTMDQYLLRMFAVHHLIHVHPHNSSLNFDPLPALFRGFQMVALKFRPWDYHYKLYNGFFRDNGLCGYLLKPSLSELRKIPAMSLKITVISGYQLGTGTNDDGCINPYIILSVHGNEKDTSTGQTSIVDKNGMNPVWNEVFTFNISKPDIALFRVAAVDARADRNANVIGQTSIPVRLLRSGFRSVRLECGKLDSPVLLFQVQVEKIHYIN